MEPQHESPEDADVRGHEQGIAEPSLLDERSLSIVSSSRSGLSFCTAPNRVLMATFFFRPTNTHVRSNTAVSVDFGGVKQGDQDDEPVSTVDGDVADVKDAA